MTELLTDQKIRIQEALAEGEVVEIHWVYLLLVLVGVGEGVVAAA